MDGFALTSGVHRLRLIPMEFKISELEREPIDFDLRFKAGVIDFGDEAEQSGPLATSRPGGGAARAPRPQGYRRRHPAAGTVRRKLRGSLRALRGAGGDSTGVGLRPDLPARRGRCGAAGAAITAPETEIGYYQKDSLLLEDVLREQVLLSLPVRTLCKPDCKGLCPRCGQNRNSQACSCDEGPSDPRWEALAGLRSRIKS